MSLQQAKKNQKKFFENANLQKFLKPYKQFFNQSGVDCKYFGEDGFNANLKNCDDSTLSLFQLNIRSLNCHHKSYLLISHC